MPKTRWDLPTTESLELFIDPSAQLTAQDRTFAAPNAPRLRRLAAERGVADDVVLTGSVPWEELPAHYDAGDVFAMPCRTRRGGLEVEGLGIVYLEGSVTSEQAREEIERIVLGVAGARVIVNNVHVNGELPLRGLGTGLLVRNR